MYVRTYVCMYVCVYIYIYIYTNICTYICMYVLDTYTYISATTQVLKCNSVGFVLFNRSDSRGCRYFPFDIFAFVCVLIREQFSRLGCVQKAFELSGSISVSPTGLAWR
jgi:hypothetical protein